MTTGPSMPPYTKLPRKSAESLDLLANVKVLDLTNSIAGPYAGQLLADLGATVVKIERPGCGDDSRAWGPPFLGEQSLWFLSVNRGKRSLALDYCRPEGYTVLRDLARQADVILVNLVARAQRKLGLDYDTLKAVNPQLIHLSLTGFGLTGARADLPCYDLIAEGYSAVMDLTGEPDGPPQKVGTPAADLLAGQDAAMATIAALLGRQKTGAGCEIDVSMVESMARFMSPRIVSFLGSGDFMRRSGGRDSVIAIYQVFDTADEPLTLGLGSDAIWKRFWEAVGEPAVAEDAAYATNASRRTHRDALVLRISGLLRQRPRMHWLEVFAKARVPAGPIHRVDEVASDAALWNAGFLYQGGDPERPVPQVGLGIRFDGRSEGTDTPPPALGEHTTEVLSSWLAYAPHQIAALRDLQIIQLEA